MPATCAHFFTITQNITRVMPSPRWVTNRSSVCCPARMAPRLLQVALQPAARFFAKGTSRSLLPLPITRSTPSFSPT